VGLAAEVQGSQQGETAAFNYVRMEQTLTMLALSDKSPLNWVPGGPSDCVDMEVDEERLSEVGYPCLFGRRDLAEYKWEAVRQPVLASPGDYEPIDYTPKDGERLFDLFRDSGLQVMVKMVSIELTPDKPESPVSRWHVEGQMNEHICATTLYYLDSENTTSSNISFDISISPDLTNNDEWDWEEDEYHWMNTNYGTFYLQDEPNWDTQKYGSVETREGRLLSFPNVL
jgi:hypothetical protein